jgi:hypothetical protein
MPLDPKELHEIATRLLDIKGTASKTRYEWRRDPSRQACAIGFNDFDEVGVVWRNPKAEREDCWRWFVTARLAPAHRSAFRCSGRAGSADEAANFAEQAYDGLMEVNWRDSGNA